MSWPPPGVSRARTIRTIDAPPICDEERQGNLTVLEQQLNREMKCVAGRNQVYIRSVVNGSGKTTPRIALKCSFRKEQGQTPDVYYEHIRDVCCCDPNECEAYRAFQKRFADL
jgi:hypothetical protein